MSAPSFGPHPSPQLPRQRSPHQQRLGRLHLLQPAMGPLPRHRQPSRLGLRPHQQAPHLRRQRTKKASDPLEWSDRDGAHKAPDGLTDLDVVGRGVAGLRHHQGLTQWVAAACGLDGLVIHHIALSGLDEQHRLRHL